MEHEVVNDLKHILIVDDDAAIRELIAQFLIKHHYLISTACNTVQASYLAQTFKFDLIILDVMMPEESGIDFLSRHPPEMAETPVLMLTALGNVDDRINGLENGADDYLPKPFEPRELLLRMEKLISRFSSTAKNIVIFGSYKFYMDSLKLENLQGEIYLTTNEQKLLKILTANLGKIVNRELIINEIGHVNARTIDAQVARLRAKIEKNPKMPQHLCTIRNQGYLLHGLFQTA